MVGSAYVVVDPAFGVNSSMVYRPVLTLGRVVLLVMNNS